MPEPATIVSASLSIAANAFKIGKETYDLVQGVKDAPKHIQRLVVEFQALYRVLGTSQLLLESEAMTKKGQMPNLMLENISAALTSGVNIFKDIQQVVAPFIAVNGKVVRSPWKGIKWELFKKNDVSVLQTALESNKQTLAIACSALTLLNTSSTNDSVEHISKDIRRLRQQLENQEREELSIQLHKYGLGQYNQQQWERDNRLSLISYNLPMHRFLQRTESIISSSSGDSRAPSMAITEQELPVPTNEEISINNKANRREESPVRLRRRNQNEGLSGFRFDFDPSIKAQGLSHPLHSPDGVSAQQPSREDQNSLQAASGPLPTGGDIAQSSISSNFRHPRRQSADQPAFRSGISKPSVENPKLLRTVEDSITRLNITKSEGPKEEGDLTRLQENGTASSPRLSAYKTEATPMNAVGILDIVETNATLGQSRKPEVYAGHVNDTDLGVSGSTAQFIVLKIFEALHSLQDLFAMAASTKGFYKVFKRHEMHLIKNALFNESPIAWELREASPLCTISNVEDESYLNILLRYTFGVTAATCIL